MRVIRRVVSRRAFVPVNAVYTLCRKTQKSGAHRLIPVSAYSPCQRHQVALPRPANPSPLPSSRGIARQFIGVFRARCVRSATDQNLRSREAPRRGLLRFVPPAPHAPRLPLSIGSRACAYSRRKPEPVNLNQPAFRAPAANELPPQSPQTSKPAINKAPTWN
jgi:hypothetical protein